MAAPLRASFDDLRASGDEAIDLGAHQVILVLQGTASGVSEYFDLADAIVHTAAMNAAP